MWQRPKNAIDPWTVGWEPAPDLKPKVRLCPACHGVPIWRHMLRCYWIICQQCGLSTPPTSNIELAAATWNAGSSESERVDAADFEEPPTAEELVDRVMERIPDDAEEELEDE